MEYNERIFKNLPFSHNRFCLFTPYKFNSMDVYGQALNDFYHYRLFDKLLLHNSYGPVEEMPVAHFFRSKADMPELEVYALELCNGKILDIGAGVGSHALVLQEMNLDVYALEKSTLASEVMTKRGVKNIINADVFDLHRRKFETLLLLMNGIGLVGDLHGLEKLLVHAKTIIVPHGQMLFDSSDIMYLYEEVELPPAGKYYGEIAYQYEYKNVKGDWFNWLYVDQQTLLKIASKNGWICQIIYEDEFGQFLASLRLK